MSISQNSLIKKVKNTNLYMKANGFNDTIVVKALEKIKDEELAYQLMIDKLPEYFARYYEIEDYMLDDIKDWFNDKRSKEIDKTIKKLSKIVTKHAFYFCNYPKYFFYEKNPLEVEALSFHKLVKLGLHLNFYFMMHYLVKYMTVKEINEYYGITMEEWGLYLATRYRIYYLRDDETSIDLVNSLLKYESESFLEGLSKGNSGGLVDLIPVIVEVDKLVALELIKILLTKAQKLRKKTLRDLIIETLKTYPENLDLVKDLIDAPKVNSRIVAVEVLIHNNEILKLNEVLAKETDLKLKTRILDYLNEKV